MTTRGNERFNNFNVLLVVFFAGVLSVSGSVGRKDWSKYVAASFILSFLVLNIPDWMKKPRQLLYAVALGAVVNTGAFVYWAIMASGYKNIVYESIKGFQHSSGTTACWVDHIWIGILFAGYMFVEQSRRDIPDKEWISYYYAGVLICPTIVYPIWRARNLPSGSEANQCDAKGARRLGQWPKYFFALIGAISFMWWFPYQVGMSVEYGGRWYVGGFIKSKFFEYPMKWNTMSTVLSAPLIQHMIAGVDTARLNGRDADPGFFQPDNLRTFFTRATLTLLMWAHIAAAGGATLALVYLDSSETAAINRIQSEGNKSTTARSGRTVSATTRTRALSRSRSRPRSRSRGTR
eukprot:TRINITY_DN2396_c0_g1_i1.p1 TRINITY_DN2396_c0_g1~~TRINITY_DN2396_c0_g1_i1.p1  ORF type:complete len:349 (+),score=35.98 TRINITY_DN2396_c0_g1_i1:134-1180(+)